MVKVMIVKVISIMISDINDDSDCDINDYCDGDSYGFMCEHKSCILQFNFKILEYFVFMRYRIYLWPRYEVKTLGLTLVSTPGSHGDILV